MIKDQNWTEQKIGKRYDELSSKLARAVDSVYDVYETCKFLSDIAQDNADPECTLSEALIHLSQALSVIIIYRDEYLSPDERDKNPTPAETTTCKK